MIATLLSTFFGVGYARVAPGTIASLVALPLAWLISWQLGGTALCLASLTVYVVGVWSCGVYAASSGRHDPAECVIDEVAGQWFACAVAPLSLVAFAIAFVLFRFFDISKLWPVSLGERLPGGLGIMTDDMIAGVLAAVIIAGLRMQSLI
jgi:phosphatidylglycerophosphatase A